MDIIMSIGAGLFFILLSFLFFLFSIFVTSLFKKKRYKDYKVLPSVSVIIPAYNEAENIKKSIESVFKNRYPKKKIECIIVDDGSTDSTASIINKLKDQYPIKFLKQAHLGKTEALNLGIKSSKNSIIITIDADTIVEKMFIRNIVRPFSDRNVGAVSGNIRVNNKSKNLLTVFQNVEYHQNNLIRHAFSKVFGTGIWFFGALGAYRRSVLEKAGGFSKDTEAEDMDIAMKIKSLGYSLICIKDAVGYSMVPHDIKGVFKQRSRWWIGGLQSLRKHKQCFSKRSNASIIFLFINQYWWSIYAFLSLPLIIYQVYYWFPKGGLEGALYLFRWFSIVGPFYVLYKIPQWGLNLYNIFGVLSGVLTLFMLITAIKMYKDKLEVKNIFAVFFYFPYTIILNLIIMYSIVKFIRGKTNYFIK